MCGSARSALNVVAMLTGREQNRHPPLYKGGHFHETKILQSFIPNVPLRLRPPLRSNEKSWNCFVPRWSHLNSNRSVRSNESARFGADHERCL